MTLGERLLEYRTSLKISQDTLAEKLGVTRQTISKWETDQSTPEFNKILPLCEVFGITPDELIKGEKSEEQEKETKIEESSKANTPYSEYTLKRNKQKGIIVSSAVFLYIIGTFFPAFMESSVGEDEPQPLIVMVVMWAVATAMLIYFFLSHPKEENLNDVKTSEERQEEKRKKVVERRVIEVISLFFLLIYLLVSFITGAWYITWVLWIVLAIVESIVKICFDLRRGEKENEE